MKILFCTQCEVSRQLGGSKVAVEIAEAMQALDWECEVRSIPDIHEERRQADGRARSIHESFREFMLENAARYDVVDYDHLYLPYPRQEFAPRTLLVARSVLLLEHLAHIRFREHRTLRGLAKKIVLRDPHGRALAQNLASARTTLAQADLINVPNDDDLAQLEKIGLGPDKITVIPYGIWWKDWPRETAPSTDNSAPTLVFLGSFDYRKGCLDLVDLARTVFSEIPGSRLKLLGTAGLFQTEKKVRSFFPRSCQDRLEVVPRFASRELPALLRGTTLGLFPSYLEGFGMAVVEMVASGIPVLAYQAPGPSSILPASCLVERGDVNRLTQRTLELLRDADLRNRLAKECTARCRAFDWAAIGRQTSEVYSQALDKLRASHP